MQWQDNGIILSLRSLNENNLIINILTENQGRYAGLIRKKLKGNPNFQPGNFVQASWKARLADHLGQWQLENLDSSWIKLLHRPTKLLALTSACTLTDYCLAERHPYPSVFESLKGTVNLLMQDCGWEKEYVDFEVALLTAVGFGFNWESCAVTRATENLKYVSPKTGHAVTEEIGEPYKDKLLRLPNFLIDPNSPYSLFDIVDALKLTGHFLYKYIFDPKGLPDVRNRFINNLLQAAKNDNKK